MCVRFWCVFKLKCEFIFIFYKCVFVVYFLFFHSYTNNLCSWLFIVVLHSLKLTSSFQGFLLFVCVFLALSFEFFFFFVFCISWNWKHYYDQTNKHTYTRERISTHVLCLYVLGFCFVFIKTEAAKSLRSVSNVLWVLCLAHLTVSL